MTDAIEVNIGDPVVRAAFDRAVRTMWAAGMSLSPDVAEQAGMAFDALCRLIAKDRDEREALRVLVYGAAIAGPAYWPGRAVDDA